ncbi:unnamed protein product, partial [Linum tenue]
GSSTTKILSHQLHRCHLISPLWAPTVFAQRVQKKPSRDQLEIGFERAQNGRKAKTQSPAKHTYNEAESAPYSSPPVLTPISYRIAAFVSPWSSDSGKLFFLAFAKVEGHWVVW